MSGSSYDNITNYGGNVHMGNVYHQGLSRDQQTLRSIIDSLRYDGMETRRDSLAEAERGTFDWAFKDAEMAVRRRNWNWEKVDLTFRPWLEGNDEGMFCVLGKPGSGKSTFMKYLSHHSDIEEACQAWLQGKRLLRAEYFFWIAGTGLQKSYVGLLRSLLHQCLLALSGSESEVDVQIVRDALQSRWSSLRRRAAWDSRELEDVISRLVLSLSDTKFLFLVDGLDEYEPQEHLDELARKVAWMSELSNVKLCVSCRPWEDLTRNLTLTSTLCIEQLTQNDMKVYLESRLLRSGMNATAHSRFRQKTAQVENLMHDIMRAAEGVFLWLELMTEELVSAIRKNGDIDRLRRVFEEFPPDLNSYFSTLIYQRIHKGKSNVSDTASALKLAMVIRRNGLDRTFDNSRSVVNFWLLQNGDLAEGMSWHVFDLEPYSTLDCERMVETTRRFLSQTCRDLLVIVPTLDARETPLHASVEFLHRSVFDFLNSHDIKLEIENSSPKHFDDVNFLNELSIMCQLCLLREPGLCDRMHSASNHAIDRYYKRQGLEQRLLSVCDRILARRTMKTCECLGYRHHFGNQATRILLQNGCTEHILAHFRRWPHIATSGLYWHPGGARNFYLEVLDGHLSATASTSIIELVRFLLMCGLPLNRLCDGNNRCGNSLWTKWLLELERQAASTRFTPDALRIWQIQTAEVASSMIQHGADPTRLLCLAPHPADVYCSHVSVDDVLETLIPLEYIGQMRSIAAEYSRDTKRQSTQRKQRLRAVRAFIVSERNQKVLEGLTRNGGNTSFIWDNEKFNFARWFLHDGMYGVKGREHA